MGFSVFVEMINLRVRHGATAPVRLHERMREEEGAAASIER